MFCKKGVLEKGKCYPQSRSLRNTHKDVLVYDPVEYQNIKFLLERLQYCNITVYFPLFI